MKGASKIDWVANKLSEICTVKDGTHDSPKYVNDGIPFVTQKNIRDGQVNFDKVKFISQKDHDKFYKRSNVELGDILIAMIGVNRGEVGLVNDARIFSIKNVGLIKANPDIDMNYLLYYLKSDFARKHVDSQSRGGAQPFIGLTKLREFPIIRPRLKVQKQIVAKLDQAFADIEKAKANAEQNLKNARELFESYLQGVFSQSQDGWTASSLKEITSKIGSGATPRGGKAAYKEQGMSLIRSMNVHDRRFKEKNLALIDDEQAGKLNNVTLEKDDVLLNITGASVARCCVVPDEYLPARVNQHVSIIRVDKDIISPRFMCFLLTSIYYKNILLEVGGSGATREAITKVQLQNFVITYPDTVEKQEEFLDELTGIESQSLELQNIYTKKTHALDELKQSILQKAFNGELA
jgi:type I restriction enzyme S subunit